jgi:hypothetical protein
LKTNRNRETNRDQKKKRGITVHPPSSFASSTPLHPTWLTLDRLDFPRTLLKSRGLSSQNFLLSSRRTEDLFDTRQPPFCDQFRRHHPGLCPLTQGVSRRQACCCLHKRSDLNNKPRLACVACTSRSRSRLVYQPLHHQRSWTSTPFDSSKLFPDLVADQPRQLHGICTSNSPSRRHPS